MASFGKFMSRLDPTTWKRPKVRQQERISGLKEDIRSDIAATPSYEIPEETQQLLDLYGARGEELMGLSELGQEATDIARTEAAVGEAPGMGIAREQIQAGTAGTVQNILEAGGGSVGAMGAIAQAGQNELNAMRDLAIQNKQFRQQASDEYRQALTSQAGMEAGLIGQATGMEAAGLQTMIGQKGLQYESELDKARTLQQFDITQLGNIQAQEEARKARNAQIFSSILGGAADIGKSVISGGMF